MVGCCHTTHTHSESGRWTCVLDLSLRGFLLGKNGNGRGYDPPWRELGGSGARCVVVRGCKYGKMWVEWLWRRRYGEKLIRLTEI